MKKIIYLSLILISMNAFSYGTLRLTGNYTNFTLPKQDIDKKYYDTLDDKSKQIINLISGKVVPSFGGGLALDTTYIFDNGLASRLGIEITAEYNQNRIIENVYKQIDVSTHKHFIGKTPNRILTGYINVYSLLGYSYKINNDLFLVMGPKFGIGLMYNYNDQRYLLVNENIYQVSTGLLRSYTVPFSGLFEVNYKKFSINFEIGGKYLIKKIKKVVVPASASEHDKKMAIMEFDLGKNDFTYDLKRLDKNSIQYKNKVVFSTSISIGINF